MTFISMLTILIGGGVLFAAVCVLDFILRGFLGFVIFEKELGTGLGLPFRFFGLGLSLLSSGYFSLTKMVLDWLIWCLVFAAIFYIVRALIRG